MERLIALAIVASIGLFIMMSDSFGEGCFRWCDVGKSLFGLGLTSIASAIVKGTVQPVHIVNNL